MTSDDLERLKRVI